MNTELVQQLGIPAAIIFTLMGAGIRWLLKDRERLLSLLETANADRMALREKRAEDLERAAHEYREFAESSREAMREQTTKMEAVLAAAGRGSGR